MHIGPSGVVGVSAGKHTAVLFSDMGATAVLVPMAAPAFLTVTTVGAFCVPSAGHELFHTAILQPLVQTHC